MRTSVTRPKLFLAILALLVAIFACTALLRAQNRPAQNEPDTPAAGDPAMATRVNNTMLQARKLIDNFFQLTSNVVSTDFVSQTIIGKNYTLTHRDALAFPYQFQRS